MEDYNVSKSNQWLINWFRTQAVTIGDKESTIILKMCQVRKEGTLPLILIVFPDFLSQVIHFGKFD
jgi:hypothetical protein